MVHFDLSILISDRDFMPVLQFDPWSGLGGSGGVPGGVIGRPLGPGPFWPESSFYQIALTGPATDILSCCFGEHRTYLADVRSNPTDESGRWDMHNRDMLFLNCPLQDVQHGPVARLPDDSGRQRIRDLAVG
jgi:hypothetical protein